ncbi:hypothetical protein DS884_07385 [Tenacibaculum sp. E3R01]|uniref:hypothetical protein n=1 Tax=Tenacibaculum sp. E3R01 TaxID=2267227 RepID=UPI000DEB4977|nr:hypothetical protein [Tenacibaculum sp. E3R01]RBW59549.1 hypothetical protein DS884_07385 [Tenacibaculum sp. E3R01]
MNQHIYYAQIRNQIVLELLTNSKNPFDVDEKVIFENKEETIFTICSEASRIFNVVKKLSNLPHTLDLTQIVNQYTHQIFRELSVGKNLTSIDLIVMAASIIQQTFQV